MLFQYVKGENSTCTNFVTVLDNYLSNLETVIWELIDISFFFSSFLNISESILLCFFILFLSKSEGTFVTTVHTILTGIADNLCKFSTKKKKV